MATGPNGRHQCTIRWHRTLFLEIGSKFDFECSKHSDDLNLFKTCKRPLLMETVRPAGSHWLNRLVTGDEPLNVIEQPSNGPQLWPAVKLEDLRLLAANLSN